MCSYWNSAILVEKRIEECHFDWKVGETLETVEVVFCGNSVYLCGLAAGLRQNAKLRIRLVDNTLEKALPELKILHPHVVIAENPAPPEACTLQTNHPDLLLIGIDAATDSFRIFAGEQPAFALEELVQVIFLYAKRTAPPVK